MADSHSNSEPIIPSNSNSINLESEILQLCLQFPEGVSDKILVNSFPNVTSEQRVSTINRLLSLNKIDLLKSSSESGTFLYRTRDTKNTTNSSISIDNGITDQMEGAVYQLIEESGNFGISMRDIRLKIQLPPIILNKTLKSLESKRIIKAVKSEKSNKKKLTPDQSITHDPWHFDEEFVRVLNKQCARFLGERLKESIEEYPNDSFLRRTRSSMSSSELASLINQMGIATVILSVQDTESILHTLISDGKK